MEKRILTYILKEFQELHEGDNWLDETFKKKLKGLSEEQAFTRPYHASIALLRSYRI